MSHLQLYADLCAWKGWAIFTECRYLSIIPQFLFLKRFIVFWFKIKICMRYLFPLSWMETPLYCSWWSKCTHSPNKNISTSDMGGFVIFKLEDIFALTLLLHRHCSWALLHSSNCKGLAGCCLIADSKMGNKTTTSSLLTVNSSCKCPCATCTRLLPHYVLGYLGI